MLSFALTLTHPPPHVLRDPRLQRWRMFDCSALISSSSSPSSGGLYTQRRFRLTVVSPNAGYLAPKLKIAMQRIAPFAQASRPSLRSWPCPSPKHTCMRPIYYTCHIFISTMLASGSHHICTRRSAVQWNTHCSSGHRDVDLRWVCDANE